MARKRHSETAQTELVETLFSCSLSYEEPYGTEGPTYWISALASNDGLGQPVVFRTRSTLRSLKLLEDKKIRDFLQEVRQEIWCCQGTD